MVVYISAAIACNGPICICMDLIGLTNQSVENIANQLLINMTMNFMIAI